MEKLLYTDRDFMNKGQISIDLLLALVMFLVMIGFLLNYTNDFVSVSQDYQSNVSGFNSYIKSYDFMKSVNFSPNTHYLINFNQDINYDNNALIFDLNNNYTIDLNYINCDSLNRTCQK